MNSSNKIVIAFDLYGTLLSTESIAKELATHFGDEKAGSIAALWRRYVLCRYARVLLIISAGTSLSKSIFCKSDNEECSNFLSWIRHSRFTNLESKMDIQLGSIGAECSGLY